MATNPKGEFEADALSAEVKALRADLTELGSLVARIGKQRAAGLKSAATSTVAEGAARGEAAIYTHSLHLIHLIRNVIIRVSTKLDWLIIKQH